MAQALPSYPKEESAAASPEALARGARCAQPCEKRLEPNSWCLFSATALAEFFRRHWALLAGPFTRPNAGVGRARAAALPQDVARAV